MLSSALLYPLFSYLISTFHKDFNGTTWPRHYTVLQWICLKLKNKYCSNTLLKKILRYLFDNQNIFERKFTCFSSSRRKSGIFEQQMTKKYRNFIPFISTVSRLQYVLLCNINGAGPYRIWKRSLFVYKYTFTSFCWVFDCRVYFSFK